MDRARARSWQEVACAQPKMVTINHPTFLELQNLVDNVATEIQSFWRFYPLDPLELAGN